MLTAYSRTRDAEMADLRPALMGWAKIAPALRAFRPQKVHRTFCRAVPEPVLTVENARKGASPSLRFSPCQKRFWTQRSSLLNPHHDLKQRADAEDSHDEDR